MLPALLVVFTDLLFRLRVGDDQELPALPVAAARGFRPRFDQLVDKFIRDRIGLEVTNCAL